MAVTYSVCVSGEGIDSFLGFEYCDLITLASRVSYTSSDSSIEPVVFAQ